MARLKKPLPRFETQDEEAEYWDKHSLLEHFDESEFKPFQANDKKDNPITIRLNSELRQVLEQVAKAHKVGPSTMARMFIVKALEQWQKRQQISLTLEDTASVLFELMPDEVMRQAEKMFAEAKAGNLYLLWESKLEELTKLFMRSLLEGAGYKIVPVSELPKDAGKKSSASETFVSRRVAISSLGQANSGK
ncbi:MAG: hypothetical protein HY670_09700 [Chloroflexi bacterium]|nr:hypothetical protein [Chloroflexota bacterium]